MVLCQEKPLIRSLPMRGRVSSEDRSSHSEILKQFVFMMFPAIGSETIQAR